MSRKRAHYPRRRRGRRPFADETLTGTVRLDANGVGTLQPEDSTRDAVHLPRDQLTRVRDGDVITVRLEVGRKGRVRGRVIGFGATAQRVVGIVKQRGRRIGVVPISGDPLIEISPTDLGDARAGDAVCVELSASRRGGPPRGSVRRRLGNPKDPRVQEDLLQNEHRAAVDPRRRIPTGV